MQQRNHNELLQHLDQIEQAQGQNLTVLNDNTEDAVRRAAEIGIKRGVDADITDTHQQLDAVQADIAKQKVGWTHREKDLAATRLDVEQIGAWYNEALAHDQNLHQSLAGLIREQTTAANHNSKELSDFVGSVKHDTKRGMASLLKSTAGAEFQRYIHEAKQADLSAKLAAGMADDAATRITHAVDRERNLIQAALVELGAVLAVAIAAPGWWRLLSPGVVAVAIVVNKKIGGKDDENRQK
ncbi:hypothetical protein [uncultured Lacticaseibacillus sp.]|uniref:hypothetical protein n=1 Tax=uncultured Lacticaseibacillus sp. TaxID=2775882 RepID=UPI002595B478|nr:hypothetical protein [uncultured Lacticaseibacillus sp.]